MRDTERTGDTDGETGSGRVAADPAYQNAKQNTPQTARIAHDDALAKVMLEFLKDDTEVYKQFVQNASFKRFVADMIFSLTSEQPENPEAPTTPPE